MANLATPVVPNGTRQDPSALTTEQTLREDMHLRELEEAKRQGDIAVLHQELQGMVTALELLQARADKVPSDTDIAIGRLEQLVNEKFDGLSEVMIERFASVKEQFSGVATQFAERDKRTDVLSASDKTRVDAALAAQEKQAIAQNDANTAANNKTEANFTKLIEQGRELLLSVKASMDIQINDLKSRLDKGEGHTKGAGDTVGWIFGGVSLLVALITSGLFVASRN